MDKEYRYYFMGFIEQKHIVELQQNNLLYEYLVLFEKLSQYGGKYIHKKERFVSDLASFTKIEQDKLLSLIKILKKHNVFNYAYGTAYINEPLLKYGTKKEKVKENQEPTMTWEEMQKVLDGK